MHVVCTAGHVDHGKSTLVRALTGMEPDRFAEEQERGLTIDLGFAWTQLGVHTVAFVDLPGHERFIANMLAGAGAIELALLVVAADEGWMPQSAEHLAILDALGVRHAVVAITKTDAVDPETAELAVELTREELAGSTLAGAEIVTVSGTTGQGLDDLRAALASMLDRAPEPADSGRPRLWIDRSFSITGAGTVVTGTLTGGWLRTGDEVVIGRQRGRIRSLQSLKQAVEAAPPGARVAVNVAGLERAAATRGQALVRPGQWHPVTAFDARVDVLEGCEVDRPGAWHVHAGSGDWTAQVSPVVGPPVRGTGFVRVELDTPALLTAGDRFVLREAGRKTTVGGGVVLDPDPSPRARGRHARAQRAAQLDARADALSRSDRGRLVLLATEERGALDATRCAAAAGLSRSAADQAAEMHGLVTIGDAWAHPAAVGAWGDAVQAALAAYHAAHPVERAAPKDVALRAATRAGCTRPLSEALLDVLVTRGVIAAEGPGVRLPDHRVELDADQAAARDALLTALASDPFNPPRLSDAAQHAGASTALVRELEAGGHLVRVGDDLAFHAGAIVQAGAALHAAYTAEGPLTAARAKEVLGTSRKYALPLLEHLDRRGMTRREGDRRHVRAPHG